MTGINIYEREEIIRQTFWAVFKSPEFEDRQGIDTLLRLFDAINSDRTPRYIPSDHSNGKIVRWLKKTDPETYNMIRPWVVKEENV